MHSLYAQAFQKLISLVEDSRDIIERNHWEFDNAVGCIFNLGDHRYSTYSAMVETNENRAATIVEELAVSLFKKYRSGSYELYPVDPKYAKLPEEQQPLTRPFQIILNDGTKKQGVVFCNLKDAADYSARFLQGKYSVDSLILVLLINPNEFAAKVLIDDVNRINEASNYPLKRVTLQQFWSDYFGVDEHTTLISFANDFNQRAKAIIGFQTVVTPTESALSKFRTETAKELVKFPYYNKLPTENQNIDIEHAFQRYLQKKRWKIMISQKNFSTSFISSEWMFNMYQLTENLDLTGIVAGYIKSVEQLLFAIFATKNLTIKTVHNGIITFSDEDERTIDVTLGSLENAVKYHINKFAESEPVREFIVEAIEEWREKYRNNYFHRGSLLTPSVVEEVRSKAFLLYALLLGNLHFNKKQLTQLGYDDNVFP